MTVPNLATILSHQTTALQNLLDQKPLDVPDAAIAKALGINGGLLSLVKLGRQASRLNAKAFSTLQDALSNPTAFFDSCEKRKPHPGRPVGRKITDEEVVRRRALVTQFMYRWHVNHKQLSRYLGVQASYVGKLLNDVAESGKGSYLNDTNLQKLHDFNGDKTPMETEARGPGLTIPVRTLNAFGLSLEEQATLEAIGGHYLLAAVFDYPQDAVFNLSNSDHVGFISFLENAIEAEKFLRGDISRGYDESRQAAFWTFRAEAEADLSDYLNAAANRSLWGSCGIKID